MQLTIHLVTLLGTQSVKLMNETTQKNNNRSLSYLFVHIILIIFTFVLPEVIFSFSGYRRVPIVTYTHVLFYIITFYISYFVLIEQFLFKKKVLQFITYALLLAIAMVILLYFAHSSIKEYIYPNLDFKRPYFPDTISKIGTILGFLSRDFAMLILAIGLSIAIKMGIRWSKIEKLNEAINLEKKEIELQNLKYQLNPHFLFNTLNNIYALVELSPQKAQESIHQLSKMLRYTLYENNVTEVLLEKELKFTENYINLMKLRLNENNTLKVKIYSGPTNNLKVAPLLFMSMIENAFKHGVNSTQPSNISIDISLNGSTVNCHTENSYFPKKENDKSGSGIGLTNLKRQLSLLYENRHTFSAHVENDTYVADLSINLKN